ncbi:hypothetical protein Hanom_Chr10g00882521 [Helianthus anomalus]
MPFLNTKWGSRKQLGGVNDPIFRAICPIGKVTKYFTHKPSFHSFLLFQTSII